MTPIEPLDGRRRRSARSRAAVVDALLDLLREGEQPSAQAIADRAGVSLRTVFRHYDDMDTLLATAVEHQLARVGHLFAARGPMGVEDFVAQRAELFEEIAGVRRAAMRNDLHPAVREGLAASHHQLREQVRSAFEIDGLTLDAVDAAASWGTWEALRRDEGLTVARTTEVMAHTIARLLGR